MTPKPPPGFELDEGPEPPPGFELDAAPGKKSGVMPGGEMALSLEPGSMLTDGGQLGGVPTIVPSRMRVDPVGLRSFGQRVRPGTTKVPSFSERLKLFEAGAAPGSLEEPVDLAEPFGPFAPEAPRNVSRRRLERTMSRGGLGAMAEGQEAAGVATAKELMTAIDSGVIDTIRGLGSFLVGGGASATAAMGGGQGDEIRGFRDARRKDFNEDVGRLLEQPLTRVYQHYSKDNDPSNLQKFFDWLGEQLQKGAQATERASGGAVKASDVEWLAEGFLSALGAKGTQLALGVDPRITLWKSKTRAGEDWKLRPDAGSSPDLTPEAVDPTDPVATRRAAAERERTAESGLVDSRATLKEVDAYRNAEQEAYDLMRRGASIKEVEARLARAGKDSPLARAMAQLRARREQVAGAKSGFEVDGVEAEIVGPGPRWEPGPAPTYGADPALGAPRAPLNRNLLAGLGVAGAATLLYGNWDVLDAEEAAALIGIGALAGMPRTAPLGAVRNATDGTLVTLERLPGKRSEFSLDEIRQQLKRPDVTKAERDAFEAVLREHKGEKISAYDLVRGLSEGTEFAQLRAKDIDNYADYGLENIERAPGDYFDTPPELTSARQLSPGLWEVGDLGGDYQMEVTANSRREAIARAQAEIERALQAQQTARTTIYQSPFEHSVPNHFGEKQYFAHTRSFSEEGVRHVVEIQSDFAQKSGKPLTAEEHAELDKQEAEILARMRLLRDERYDIDKILTTKLDDLKAQGLNSTDSKWQEFVTIHRQMRRDLIVREEMQNLRVAELRQKRKGDEVGEAQARVAPMLKNWYKRIVDEEIATAVREKFTENPAWLKARLLYERSRANVDNFRKNQGNLWPDRLRDYETELAKLKQKLDAIPQYFPPPKVMRFATADTVAKVEGWQPLGRNLIDGLRTQVRLAEEGIRMLERYAQDGIPLEVGALDRAKERLRLAQEALEEELRTAGPRFSKEHQGIYDRYKQDIEKYLKQKGGREVTDDKGHTWIEVPLPAEKSSGARVPLFGGVPISPAGNALLKSVGIIGGSVFLAQVLNEMGLAGAFAPEGDAFAASAATILGLIAAKETFKAQGGANVQRLAQMLGPKLYGSPAELSRVTVKELYQNSFDAVRTALTSGKIKKGRIEFSVDEASRTIAILDNGVGMTPQVLAKQFLQIAGTAKEGAVSSGGFGIAKMLFLYANDGLEVITARDGKVATMRTGGEQLMRSLDDPEAGPEVTVRPLTSEDKKQFPSGSGTYIRVKVPSEYKDASTGEMKPIQFSESRYGHRSLSHSPLFQDIDVTWNGQEVYAGSRFPKDEYTQFANVNFEWGQAKIYISKAEQSLYGENTHVLSNSIWQFSTKLSKKPGDMWGDPIGRTLYIDVAPKVKAEEAGYPFDLSRQGFAKTAESDMGKVLRYIQALYIADEITAQVADFGTVNYVDVVNGRVQPSVPKKLEPQAVRSQANLAIREGDSVEVINGNLIVNGRQVPELKPEDLKDQVIDIDALRIPQSEISPDRVMVHSNVLVPIGGTADLAARFVQKKKELGYTPYDLRDELDKRKKEKTEYEAIDVAARGAFGPKFDEFNYRVGKAFQDLRDFTAEVMGQIDPEYSGLRTAAVGISYDVTYRGVSTKLPIEAFFVNPAATRYSDPLRAAYGAFGTMVHELAHFKVRGHDADFPAEMQNLLLNLESADPLRFQRIKDAVMVAFTSNADLAKWLNERVLNEFSQPVGRRFKDSDEQAGTRDVGRNVDRDGGSAGGGAGLPPGPPAGPQSGAGGPNPGRGPGRSQRGAVDPDLARAIATLGLGATLGHLLFDDAGEWGGAAFGAALVGAGRFARSRSPELARMGKELGGAIERAVGIWSTAVGELSQPVLRRARELERAGMAGTYASIDKISGFVSEFSRAPEEFKRGASLLLFNGNEAAALRALPASLAESYKTVRTELTRLGAELKRYGLISDLLPGYFPRVVKDYEGLLGALDLPVRDGLTRAVDAVESKMMRQSGRKLTDVERSVVINKFLATARPQGVGKPGFSKPRRIDEVTEELLPFYDTPEVSLTKYVSGATWAIEKAKFFGRELQRDTEGRIDIGNSIANYVEAERRAGRLQGEEVAKLTQLLNDRFVGGEKAGSSTMQTLRTGISVGLIANVASAGVQIGDIWHSVTLNGLLPTVRAVGSVLGKGTDRVTAREFGMVNHLAEELVTAGSAAKIADFAFKWSGFRIVDLFAKDVFLTAAAQKARQQSLTRRGVEDLRRRYGEYFGPRDFEQLIADLQNRNRSVFVDELLFAEIARVQPIARSELPPAFLANPEARLLWTVKSWMLKQLDLGRREVWGELKKGNVAKATEMGLRIGAALYLSNVTGDAIRNWMLGRETPEQSTEEVLADVPYNLLKTFGVSDYFFDQVQSGKGVEAIIGLVAAPIAPVADVFNFIADGDPRVIRNIPIVGRHLESYGTDELRTIPVVGDLLSSTVVLGVGPVPPGRERWQAAEEKRRAKRETRNDPLEAELRQLRKEFAREGIK